MIFYTIFCYLTYVATARYVYLKYPKWYDDGVLAIFIGIFAPITLPLGVTLWLLIKVTDWLFHKFNKEN